MDHADQPTPGIESEQAWRQYGRYSYKQFRKWTKEGEYMNLELAPSILSADFGNLAADMAETARAGARYAHIDVMDGMFVPQISLGMPVIKSIRPASDLVFDVHMMVTKPERYIDAFADCGADIITFHLEATEDPDACIEMIRARGVKVGLSIKPGTPVEAAEPSLDKIDMLLIMTVEPGFGGQKFIPASYERIPQARKMITDRNLNVDIEVDGGIKLDNVDSVLDAGANIIVAGSAVYGKDTYGCTKAFLDDFAAWQAKQ